MKLKFKFRTYKTQFINLLPHLDAICTLQYVYCFFFFHQQLMHVFDIISLWDESKHKVGKVKIGFAMRRSSYVILFNS